MTGNRFPPDALLIDFDGVLRTWPDIDVEIAGCGLPAGALLGAAFEPGLLTCALTGKLSDASWRGEVAMVLAARFPHAETATAIMAWSRSIGIIDPVVLSMLASVRQSTRLVLVSNATSRLGADLTALGLDDFFHAVVNSSETGAAKPDEAIFRAALMAAGTTAENALFIDDALSNVEAARALGIRSAQFVGHESLRIFLRDNGLAVDIVRKATEGSA